MSTLLLVGGTPDTPVPLRLAIYYGYPSLVNGAGGDLARVVAHLSPYDVLVLGDGLEFDTADAGHAGPAEHQFTRRLVQQLARTPRRPVIFGYVDLGRTHALTPAELTDRIDRWGAMGVAGVFLDEAGYDFGVTRERQNHAVRAARARGLRVFFNAYRPEDVFGEERVPINAAGGGNPAGQKPLLSARDAILLESFAVGGGVVEAAAPLAARVRAALAGRRRFGTRVFAIATGGDDVELAQYGWRAASSVGLDAYGWSDPGYGARTSQLRWIAPPVADVADAAAAAPAPHGKDSERWNVRAR